MPATGRYLSQSVSTSIDAVLEVNDRPFSFDFTLGLPLSMPSTVDRYAEKRKHVARSVSISIFLLLLGYRRSAMAAATQASTAFNAEVASVSLKGQGRWTTLLPFGAEKITSLTCSLTSCGICWSASSSNLCKDFRHSSRTE